MQNNFLILPYSILETKELNLSEKIILAEILSLLKIKGACYASNSYFSKRAGLTPRTVSNSISTLKAKGYISFELSSNRVRTIEINKSKLKDFLTDGQLNYYEKFSDTIEISSTPVEKSSSPIEKTSNYNNIYNNNKNNNYNNRYNGYNTNYCDFHFLNSDVSQKRSYDLEELLRIK